MDCNRSYIGETGRNLKKRLVEHKAAVKRGDMKNGIAVHAWEQQHRVNWDEADVLVQEPRYWSGGGKYWKLWRYRSIQRTQTWTVACP